MALAGPVVIDTGYRRSPTDHRDWSYRDRVMAAQPIDLDRLPRRWRVDQRNPLPVYRQQGPSCVGWIVATAQTALERFDKRRTVRHDGQEFYSHIALPDGGAYIRDALKLWRDLGVRVEGSDTRHRIAGFAAVNPRDHDAVRHAMRTGHGLCIGFEVTRQWADGGGAEFADDGTSDVLGGHGSFVSGWEAPGPLDHNTWGEDWSGDGRAVLPWSYWDRRVWECWAVLDVND